MSSRQGYFRDYSAGLKGDVHHTSSNVARQELCVASPLGAAGTLRGTCEKHGPHGKVGQAARQQASGLLDRNGICSSSMDGPESTTGTALLKRPLFWLSKMIRNIFHETEYFTLRDPKTFLKLLEISVLAASCCSCW